MPCLDSSGSVSSFVCYSGDTACHGNECAKVFFCREVLYIFCLERLWHCSLFFNDNFVYGWMKWGLIQGAT